MRYLTLTVAVLLMMPLSATAAVEKEYDPSKPLVTTPWFGAQNDASRQADLQFVAGMRPHHAGALSMSQDYLADKDASHPTLKRLARGIMHNQTFEIGVLDMVERYAKQEGRQIAAEGQAQAQKFQRAPMPAGWGVRRDDPRVSARDVQFSKAMIVHHQGAVDMCRDYNRDPAVNNLYLKKLCLDIIVDQEQEIGLMEKVIAAYAGDAGKIVITPDMIHGMEGMSHGAHGGGHHH